MCVVFNYVHVFALFRGSLCLLSLCVSRVVFVCVCVWWFLLTQRDINGSVLVLI